MRFKNTSITKKYFLVIPLSLWRVFKTFPVNWKNRKTEQFFHCYSLSLRKRKCFSKLASAHSARAKVSGARGLLWVIASLVVWDMRMGGNEGGGEMLFWKKVYSRFSVPAFGFQVLHTQASACITTPVNQTKLVGAGAWTPGRGNEVKNTLRDIRNFFYNLKKKSF